MNRHSHFVNAQVWVRRDHCSAREVHSLSRQVSSKPTLKEVEGGEKREKVEAGQEKNPLIFHKENKLKLLFFIIIWCYQCTESENVTQE